jgi:hypothetical protein
MFNAALGKILQDVAVGICNPAGKGRELVSYGPVEISFCRHHAER